MILNTPLVGVFFWRSSFQQIIVPIFVTVVAGKVWIGDNELAWRTEQSFKRISPLIPCTTATTTTTTGGGTPAHPHLSPPIAVPVTTPDHRSPSSLHVKLGISGKSKILHSRTRRMPSKMQIDNTCKEKRKGLRRVTTVKRRSFLKYSWNNNF